jgi:hypothetical protein
MLELLIYETVVRKVPRQPEKKIYARFPVTPCRANYR